MVICLELGADLHMAQLMQLPLTVTCFSKIQIGFIFLVPAHPGIVPDEEPLNGCVCVCVCVRQLNSTEIFHKSADGREHTRARTDGVPGVVAVAVDGSADVALVRAGRQPVAVEAVHSH